MKCPHCNTENSEYSYKCVKCGKELASSPNVYKTDRDYESPMENGDLYADNDYDSPTQQDIVHTDRSSQINLDNQKAQDKTQQQIEEVSRKIEDLVKPFAAPGGQAKSKMQKLLVTYIFLIIFFPMYTAVPIVGLIFCIKGLNEIKNGQQDKYEKTLKIVKVLIPVSIILGIALSIKRFVN